MNRTHVSTATALLAALTLMIAPATLHAEHHLAGEAEAAAEELKDNVEHSEELEEKTYDDERAEGTGRVEAAGNAYEAVLEAGREKADE
jgi:hypothetical protein